MKRYCVLLQISYSMRTAKAGKAWKRWKTYFQKITAGILHTCWKPYLDAVRYTAPEMNIILYGETKTAGIILYDINGIYHTHKILVPEEELEEDLQEIKKPEGDNETEAETNIMQRVLKQAAKIGN